MRNRSGIRLDFSFRGSHAKTNASNSRDNRDVIGMFRPLDPRCFNIRENWDAHIPPLPNRFRPESYLDISQPALAVYIAVHSHS
jgi:hypothetical protein